MARRASVNAGDFLKPLGAKIRAALIAGIKKIVPPDFRYAFSFAAVSGRMTGVLSVTGQ